jgi:hypothetical protein
MNRITRVLLLAAATLALSTLAGATPIPSCTDSTVENHDVTTITNGCTLGGLTFTDFIVNSAPPGSTVFLSSVGTGLVTGGVDLGFQVTTVAPPVDVILFYTVSGPSIIGVDNQQNGVNGVRIQELVCSVSFSSTGICPGQDVLANFVNPPTTSATFAPQTTVYIMKDISLPNENSFISSFVNSQETGGVPEPATMALFGLGLLGMGLAGRKTLRRR